MRRFSSHGIVVGTIALGWATTAWAETPDGADRCGPALLGESLGALVTGIGTAEVGAFQEGLIANRARAKEAAKTRARQLARSEIRAKVCGALTDPRDCDAEMAQVMAPVERFYDDDRWVCVVEGVEASRVGRNTAAGRAQVALNTLSETIVASLRAAPVPVRATLDVVRTVDGCSVVELQAARQQIESQLSGRVQLVPAGTGTAAGVWNIALEATSLGSDVQLLARLTDPSGTDARSMPPALVPAAAYGVQELRRTCAAPVRPRAGKGGLTATLSMPTNVCAGETVSPTLEVSAPSRVQVWSVSPDGTALLLVPGADERGGRVNGNWTGARTLPSGMATPSTVTGDEMLVAVATPADLPPRSNGPTDFCRAANLPQTAFPEGAAITTFSWRVLTDPARCPKVAEATALARQAQDVIARAPACW